VTEDPFSGKTEPVTAEQFLEFAGVLPEPLCLVSSDGQVLALNPPAAALPGVGEGARGRAFAELVTDPPEKVADYLRDCSRSRELIQITLSLRTPDGPALGCQCEGAALRPRKGKQPSLILLRLRPDASSGGKGKTTARKLRKTEGETTEQRERWQVTLSSIGDAVIATDAEGRVTFMNSIAESLTGWTDAEAEGKPLKEVFRIINEFTRQEVENPVAKVIRKGTVVGLANHTILVARDGTERPIDDSGAPIRDEAGRLVGVVLVFRDITERRQAEVTQLRLAAIVESSDDAIISKTLDGIITSWNTGAERIFGYTAGEVIGQPITILIPPDRPNEEPQIIERLRRGERIDHYETVRVRKDGRRIDISLTVSPIRDAEGQIIGASKIARDITERKRIEEELHRQREWFRVTLSSIGDAVIATDARGEVTFVNPVAQGLTGWAQDEATGRPLETVFTIVNEETRRTVENPIARVIREGVVVGLANHTVLIARDGTERPIDDSGAPIRDDQGRVLGAVLVFRDVTERRRAEDELRKSRDQLEVILQGVADGIMVLDATGQLVRASDDAARILGFPSVEALLQVTRQEIRDKFDVMDESGRPFPFSQLPGLRALGGEHAQNVLRFRIRATGEERWVIVKATPILDERGEPRLAVSIFHDITERKRIEEAEHFLAEAGAALASTLDYEATLQSLARLSVPRLADWCVVYIIRDGELQRLAMAHVDPAREKLAWEASRRYPPDMKGAGSIARVLQTGKAELYPDITDEMIAGAARDAEHLGYIRELGLRSGMLVPLTAHGQRLGVISFVSAESGRRYGQTDLALAESLAGRAALAIDHARLYQEAQAANRIKDEFLATVSHELRTPLNAIKGWAHLLGSGKLDKADSSRAVETINRNARAQGQIIDDLLDVSRIISGKLRLNVGQVELPLMIAAAVDTVRLAAEAKNIRLRVSIEPGDIIISGDPDRLQQVVWNLLSNAVKFTPPGGRIEVRLEKRISERMKSEVGSRKSESETPSDSSFRLHPSDFIQITVSDTGQGISPDFLPYIFDRFRQADNTTTRPHGGLGLGLAIARHLVELHGGTIRAESEGAGRGTTFIVRLPLHAVRPERGDLRPSSLKYVHAPGEMVAGSPLPLAGVRILAVDDEPDTRDLLSVVLRQRGAEVLAVASAAEALDQLAAFSPHVLVADIGMPGEDGYTLLRKVRALGPERGGRVPAVALTAYARADDRIRALAAGFQIHVPKPVEPDELVTVVTSLIGRSGEGWKTQRE